MGTNLGNKTLNLNHALSQIEKNIGLIAQKSSIYETKPWGYQSFNNFLNQVVQVETTQSAPEVLRKLLQIEKSMGRNRDNLGYQDRTIDLDIIFFNEDEVAEQDLIVPHPKMHLRAFILEPMCEIQPNFMHPVFKKSIATLLTELKES